MTLETTLAPPKEKPWHKCSVEGCPREFRAYAGKVGCKCHTCDDITPQYRKDANDLEERKLCKT